MSAPSRTGADEAGSDAARLAELRERIEELDRSIIRQVAERVDAARSIGRLKRELGSGTLDPEREAAVIRRAVETARAHGLPAEGVRELFWSLMSLCRGVQMEDR